MGLKHQLAISTASALNNSLAVDSVFKILWQNPGREHGLRLTKLGFELLTKQLRKPCYKIALVSPDINSVDIIRLERFFTQPYYYAREGKDCNMYMFDPEVATQLMLYNGDLARFLDAWDTMSLRPVNYRPEK